MTATRPAMIATRPAMSATRQGPPPHRPRWRVAGAAALVLGAAYAIARSAGNLREAAEAVVHDHPGGVALAGVFEVASYVLLGLLVRRLAGTRAIDRRTAIRVGLVTSGLGGVLPAAPAGGLALASTELRGRRVPTSRTALTLGLVQWYTTRALFGLVAVDALTVSAIVELRGLSASTRLVAMGAGGAFVLVLLAATAQLMTSRRLIEGAAVTVGRVRSWRRPMAAEVHRAVGTAWHAEITELVGPRRHQLRLTALGLGACVADALCFQFALMASGVHVRPPAILLAYGVSMVAAMVPFLPAGIGLVETIVPAMLRRAHVPVTTALAGVLAYRALATLLPAIAGAIALAQLRAGRTRPSRARTTAAVVAPAIR